MPKRKIDGAVAVKDGDTPDIFTVDIRFVGNCPDNISRFHPFVVAELDTKPFHAFFRRQLHCHAFSGFWPLFSGPGSSCGSGRLLGASIGLGRLVTKLWFSLEQRCGSLAEKGQGRCQLRGLYLGLLQVVSDQIFIKRNIFLQGGSDFFLELIDPFFIDISNGRQVSLAGFSVLSPVQWSAASTARAG